MHASLILLATSLAASVVGAPVPTVSPFESPAPMLVRDANSEAISPVLENLKRQILERLDAIVQRSVSDYVEDDDATLENDKREGHSLGVRAAHDKREGGPGGSVNPSAHDKREGGPGGSVNPSAHDKREGGPGGSVNPSAHDKREGGPGGSVNPSAHDKREGGPGGSVNPSAHDKREGGPGGSANPSAHD